MRVVLGYLNFEMFAGTEGYTLTVSRQLERLGHETTIYATHLGPMADYATSLGARVVSTHAQLPATCDAVIAQDASTAYQLAGLYPEAVRVFVMHSRFPLQSLPQLSEICSAVVVMNDRLRRRAEHVAVGTEVVRLRQPIDLVRFGGRRGRPRRPPRVLSLSNYLYGAREQMIEAACVEAGFALSRLGAHSETSPHPEHAISGADIVISLGRGAIEAMAAGRAAYIFGPVGGDGWVTPGSYPELERDGFSGRATDTVVDLRRLVADLGDWQEGMGESNRELAWAHHDAEAHAIELVDLIARLGPPCTPPVKHAEELARLVRMEWHEFGRAQAALLENHRARARIDELSAELTELRDAAQRSAGLELELRETHARLAALLNLRRFRLASQVAKPLDRLRSLWRAMS